MTEFLDGPAKGQHLMLRRTPLLLRVVRSPKGKWDALDQPTDMPEPEETIHVYRLVKVDGHAMVCMRGGRGGAFALAKYTLHDEQPNDETARSAWEWPKWARAQAERMEKGQA